MSGGRAVEPDATAEADPAPRPDEAVRCRFCGHTITSRRKATQVGGAHEHTFRNPSGYSFHLKCFSDAPGSLRVGGATAADSWFAGYEWCYAVCGECHEHLGWWYVAVAGGESFAGLIATRLAGG